MYIIRILVLNVWAGRCLEELIKFLERYRAFVDIFCFQEIFNADCSFSLINGKGCGYRGDLLTVLESQLPAHNMYFAAKTSGFTYHEHIDVPLDYGNGVFVSQRFNSFSYRELFEAATSKNDKKTFGMPKAQLITLRLNGLELSICNFHGRWVDSGVGQTNKNDTPERISDALHLKESLNRVRGEKILCGDFNLLPHTESLAILEEGMVNLVKTHKVTSTRTDLYTKPERFADYVLVDKSLIVNKFKVLDDIVSDHYPLFLELVI